MSWDPLHRDPLGLPDNQTHNGLAISKSMQTGIQGATGWGGLHRRGPTGGAAYGIPRYSTSAVM